MKINNNITYQPSFKARLVNNQALRCLVRDVKGMYGDKYLKTAVKKFSELGTNQDEIKFVYSTWIYQKGLGTTPRKEGVTFVLVNDKYIGHFENRFISNFLSKAKTHIEENKPVIQITPKETKQQTEIKIKKEHYLLKKLKAFFKDYY